jgi:WD40 repeat protein
MEVATLEGHYALASDTFFSHDGNSIYSEGQDGEIRLWEAPPLSRLATPVREAVTSLLPRAQATTDKDLGPPTLMTR